MIPSFSVKFVILVLCTSPLCCILEYLSDLRLRSALPDLLFALLLSRSVLRDLFGGGYPYSRHVVYGNGAWVCTWMQGIALAAHI